MFQILHLSPDHLPQMRGINALFGDVFEDPDHYASARPSDEWLRTQLANPNVIALAALDGDAIVGGLTSYVLPKLEQEQSEIYIYDLAVAQSHWRRGIATALIGALQDMAKARGAWVIYVQADYGDEPAIALYTKLGVREDVMHFDIAPR
ncbi:MAG: AAC(3)-I family aminoglycoside N-acetyltransferase [Sphingopyxis sp.]|nr:AAC(3)-I family aminoglycoside N-acetyltransferase [Sphingopyxis sp.]